MGEADELLASESQPPLSRPPRVVESVLRATRLLEAYEAGRPEMTLSELVDRVGYSKSTTYRLLLTLSSAGWLERTPHGTFRLSLKAFRLGSIVVDSLDLRREAIPIMSGLAAACGASAYLVIAAGRHAVCLERIDAGDAVRVADLQVGGSQPLHLGAGPRALLAFNEEVLLGPLLSPGLEARTPHSIVDPAALRADLAEIRRRGYAISRGDATAGVGALGAPVFDATARAVAALSVGGLLERVSPEREPEVSARLLACSRELSARLGADPPPVSNRPT